MLLYSCICVTVTQGGNMAKLKTIFLLVLAGFILVGCGDPRADDKTKLTDAVVAELGDVENAADVAECVVGVMSEAIEDDNTFSVVAIQASEGDDAAMKFMEENEMDEEATALAIMSAFEKAEGECEVDV